MIEARLAEIRDLDVRARHSSDVSGAPLPIDGALTAGR